MENWHTQTEKKRQREHKGRDYNDSAISQGMLPATRNWKKNVSQIYCVQQRIIDVLSISHSSFPNLFMSQCMEPQATHLLRQKKTDSLSFLTSPFTFFYFTHLPLLHKNMSKSCQLSFVRWLQFYYLSLAHDTILSNLDNVTVISPWSPSLPFCSTI